MHRVLEFVQELMFSALRRDASDYQRGYVHALEDVEEFVEDLMWETGDE